MAGDELIDIFDENNKHSGIQKLKSEAHKKGLWHRALHVWLYNSKREILIQLRSKDKVLCPNMWDISAAGHVLAGEKLLECALREVREELGLKIKRKDLEFFKIRIIDASWPGVINREFCYTYLLKFDGKISDLKVQKSEIQAIKFVPIEEIEEELKNDPKIYSPNAGWKEIIDEIKRKL